MPNVLVRGLHAATLSRLRAQARRRGLSVNRLIVEVIERQAPPRATSDELDALAGSWSRREADDFDAAVAAFSKVDPDLWAGEPRAAHRVRRRRARPRR